MKNRYSVFTMILSFILTAIGLISCASTGQKPGPSGDLRESVVRYYDGLVAADYAQSWALERMSVDEDAEQRENARRTYMSRMGKVQTKNYQILEIGQEGTGRNGFTIVKMKLKGPWPSLPMPMPEGDREWTMDTFWQKIDGKWYHVVYDSVVDKYW